jgi:ketosteroid isomerase-like protein
MKSRLLLAVVLLSFVGTFAPVPVVAAESDPAKLLPDLEKSLWEGWKNRDAAPFEKYLAEGAINVSGSGFEFGKAANVAAIKSSDCKVASFSLGEITVTRFGDSTAVLTYTASQDATCKGEKIQPKVLATSVWVKQGAEWRSAVYHESPPAK